MTTRSSPRDILIEAQRRKIRLTPDGTRLITCGQLTPEFEQVLRDHKPALLKLIRSKRHLAKQVLAGEFADADDATWYSIIYSLLDNHFDPLCRKAIDHLKASQFPVTTAGTAPTN